MERDLGFSCLFCASDCNSNVQNIETDEEDGDPPALLFQEDPAVREQLKAYFILSKILRIPNESLGEFLRENNGHSKLEFWAKVCGSCGPLVRQFYDTLKQVSKLEKILVGIEVELKGKIVESKDKEVEGPTAHILKNIRTQLLEQHTLNSNGNDLELNLADFMIQDWNVNESNEETVPHDDAEVHKRSGKKRPRSRSHSTKNEKENIEPDKKRVKDSNPEQFFQDDVDSDNDSNYECDMCSYKYKTNDASEFAFHITNCHEGNSGIVGCSGCLAFFAPRELEPHRNLCQPHLARHPGIEKKLGKSLTNGKMRNVSSKNESYISFQRGKFTGWQYQCQNCPYETLHLSRIQAHIEIHGEILSGEAVSCELCGWHMLLKYLDDHQALNHPGEEIESDPQMTQIQNTGSNEGTRRNRNSFKCSKCPYESMKRLRLESHLKVHQEGSRAAPCKECGWFLLPNAVNHHRVYCAGRRGR